MQQLDYRQLFSLVLKERLLNRIEYIQALFTIPFIENNIYKSDILDIKDNKILITLSSGVYELNYYKFPILDYLDNVVITPNEFKCLAEELETSIGIVMSNYLIVELPFSGKINFINGVITSKIESTIAERLVSNNYVYKDEKDAKIKIKVSELINYIDNCEYIKTWNHYFVVAASKKTLLPPAGSAEEKQKIVKQMLKDLGPDAFKDQVNIIKLEEELKKLDKEFLKDDPTLGIVTSGKVLNNSRKELFLTMGGIPSFDEDGELSFVLNSLLEGWPDDPEMLSAMFNSLRAGSLARALDTQYGGLFAKIILRAIGSYIVKPDFDCGTKLGADIDVNNNNYKTIIYRNVIDNGNTILVDSEDMAKTFINKKLIIRGPETCASPGETYCGYCVSKLLRENPDGIKNEVTTVTAIVLDESMKKMHNTTKSAIKLNKEEIFS